MLPAAHRLRSSADFAQVLRRGRSAGRPDLVLHLLSATDTAATPPAISRAGLVVGRRVGGSVVRHRVSRRLRGQLADRIEAVPPGSMLVIRARPGAATADSARLGEQLDSALRQLTGAGRRE